MWSISKILDLILSSRPDLTREDVERMIQSKKKGAGGLLTDEGAAHIVATELGIKLSDVEEPKTGIMIKDLVANLDNVSLTGRVLSVHPVRSFTRSDGSEGKVSSLLIADKSGLMRVVLWDERTVAVSQNKLSTNQVVRFLHGYVRRGLDNELELNIGKNGRVIISPPAVDPSDYPETKSFFKKIGELSEEDKYVNLVGVLSKLSPITTFRRSSGDEGQVMRVRVVDETGRACLVLWGDKVDAAMKAKRGWFLKVTAARVKQGIGGGIEVHAGKQSEITASPEVPVELKAPLLSTTKISELKPGMPDVDVLSKVVQIGPVREFERPSGETGQVVDVILNDGSGSVRLVAWNEQAEAARGLSVGDVVLVEGAYTREGAMGVSLNLGKWGIMTVNPSIPEKAFLPPVKEEKTPIDQLILGLGVVTVEGTISESPTVKSVTTLRGQAINVASFTLRDETGQVKASLWRDLAETIRDLREGTRIRVYAAYVKEGLDGRPELSSGAITRVKILSKPGVKSKKQGQRGK